jgi:hypothetical protein
MGERPRDKAAVRGVAGEAVGAGMGSAADMTESSRGVILCQ